MKNLTKSEIKQMNYTDFIALIKETNRCPGGKDSIRKIIQNSFINSSSKVLEIGSNTGFTSLEIAHIVKCEVKGIDVSENCVIEARNRLAADIPEIQSLVNFSVGSAYEIPYHDNYFDLVVSGGATSFMDEKQKAISEYIRVVTPWGFISATQLFYIKQPPKEVLEKVSEAIGARINAWSEEDWLKIFKNSNTGLELYYFEQNELQSRPDYIIEEYIDYFLKKPHLQNYPEDIKEEIRKKWLYYINIFNENHKYLGYFIALFRKTKYPEEPELFIKK
jgi:ubiquinone/menaquinone biosynthesis C-methylase UbiE